MKGKMRASSTSLTGWLSLRGDEDEPSVCVSGYVCMYSVPMCVCTLTTASSCHCQHLMELPEGQHFIISVALSIAQPSFTVCKSADANKCLCAQPVVHITVMPLSHVNITRKRCLPKMPLEWRPVIGNASSSCYLHTAEVLLVFERPIQPPCLSAESSWIIAFVSLSLTFTGELMKSNHGHLGGEPPWAAPP